jgi:hypothetical protein
VLDNFSSSPPNVEGGLALVVSAVNQSTTEATKTIQDKDFAVKAIRIAKIGSRCEEVQPPSALRKLDTTLPT